MPLIEYTHTRTFDGEALVDEASTERKLYTLAELREVGGSGYDRALDWLREGQFDGEWWYEGVIDDAVGLFEACGITVPQKTETTHVKVDGKFTQDERGNFVTKTITRDDTIWDSWDVDRGEFTLNRRAVVDERAFLQALQWYLAGKDIRDLPALGWGQPTPPRPLTASPRGQRTFDLRSKDARIISEQGLVIHRVDAWRSSGTREFNLDYHYDGLSEQTMADCNELLSDLCHEVISLLRDEAEYRSSEEALLEMAEANDYRFTEEGRVA
jgi:hypothetical protein